jgi:DNA-nicking Smr family endonuclease
MPGQNDDHADDSEDERSLFRRAMQDVRPLKSSQRVVAPRRAARARPRLARSERAAGWRESLETPGSAAPDVSPGTDLFELQPGDELMFRRAGVPETVLRRLRRGLYHVDSELDLHGCTVAEARGRLAEFLQEAGARQLQCVRIIHGKGLRSGTRGPVLKNWVNAQLRHAAQVLAFASARPVAGGTGATLVLLSRA